jgi:hypothetical protein
MRINEAMGVKSRADAGEAQLRIGVRQVQAWLADPDLFFAPVPSQRSPAQGPVPGVASVSTPEAP